MGRGDLEAVLTKFAYRADIDGIRSIAVLLVLLFHFEMADVFGAGFIGVDMFFVISGYLIISIINDRLDNGRFSFRSFYAARIRRLAPALLATTVLTLLVALVILTPGELATMSREAIAAQLYVSNIYYWRFLNYFGLQADQSFFLHTWSLAVEEQFYLFFPAFLWLTAKARLRWRQILLLAVLVGSFALNLAMISSKPEATFYLLPTRAWEFAAGGFTPLLSAQLRRVKLPSDAMALIGISLIAAAFFIYDATIAFPGCFAVLPVVGTMFLIIAGETKGSLYCRIMGSTPFVYVGRISYELYLVHWPIRVFAPMLILDYSWGVRAAALLLCFPLAAALYHGIERPIRSRHWLGRDRSLVVAYGATSLAMLAVLGFMVGSGGLADRLSVKARTIAASSGDMDSTYRSCESRTDDLCRIGANRTPSWLVYGDSHADALGGAFDTYLRRWNEAGYLSFQSGCLPVRETGGGACRNFNEGLAAFIARHPEVTNIVLVSTWRQPLELRYTNEQGRIVRGEAALAAFARTFDKTVAPLEGRRIVVWMPVPGAKHAVPVTLARDEMLGRQSNLAVEKSTYDQTFAFLTKAVSRHPSVISIRPAEHMCEPDCALLSSGRPLYHDAAHPAGSQKSYFATIIEKELSRQR